MGYKKWVGGVLGALALCLCATMALVATVDPFFHYHAPFEGLSWQLYNEYYQNSGIVRNFEYDTLVTGSSMSENIKTSWVEELYGGRAVKACFEGATTKNLHQLMTLALKAKPGLKRVFLGLDVFLLEMNPSQVWSELPAYLYDANPLNDVSYLLNKSVVDISIDELRRSAEGEPGLKNFDGYGAWGPRSSFGRDVTLETYEKYWDPAVHNDYMRAERIDPEWVRRNLEENLLPSIENYPGVEFIVSLPPYSLLFWQARLSRGHLDDSFTMLRTVTERLLACENVKLYSFLNWPEVTENLDNYKDPIHHSPEVNRLMLEEMAAGRHRLDNDNCGAELDALYQSVTHYDFEALRQG